MKLLNWVLLLSLLFTASCSTGKKDSASESGDETVTELEEDADFIVDADDEELVADDEDSETEEIASSDEESNTEEAIASSSTSEVMVTDEIGEYTVKKGDTLMLVAFSLYGDYRKWKDIKNFNSLSGGLSEGSTLRYQKPAQDFVWSPEGNPHLVKSGDSLVSISKDKYGTSNKWKRIFDNNQPLIRDPNLIFAGFTLYYIPERDLASE